MTTLLCMNVWVCVFVDVCKRKNSERSWLGKKKKLAAIKYGIEHCSCLWKIVFSNFCQKSISLCPSWSVPPPPCPRFEQRQGHLFIIQPLITSRGSRLNEVSVNTESVHLVSSKCIFPRYLTCPQNSSNSIKLVQIWQSPQYTEVTGHLRMWLFGL